MLQRQPNDDVQADPILGPQLWIPTYKKIVSEVVAEPLIWQPDLTHPDL